MKFREYIAYFKTRAETSNTVFRQLAFGGLAIVWLFKQENRQTGITQIPLQYKTPVFFFISSLSADLLQYFIPAIIHGGYALYLHLYKRKEEKDEHEVNIFLFSAEWIFFLGKMVLLMIGYVKLLLVTVNNFH